jgi:hypothetical protein
LCLDSKIVRGEKVRGFKSHRVYYVSFLVEQVAFKQVFRNRLWRTDSVRDHPLRFARQYGLTERIIFCVGVHGSPYYFAPLAQPPEWSKDLKTAGTKYAPAFELPDNAPLIQSTASFAKTLTDYL